MKTLRWVVTLAVTGLVIWSAAAHPWAWLYGIGVHPYPASSSTPWTYQLLSGFIPALTVVGLFTLISGAWHHVNCHQRGCWRTSKHKVNGSPWCSRHLKSAQAAAVADDPLAQRLDRIIALLENRDPASGG